MKNNCLKQPVQNFIQQQNGKQCIKNKCPSYYIYSIATSQCKYCLIFIKTDLFHLICLPNCPSGSGTGFPILGSDVQNHWVAPVWTQSFLFLGSIKWVQGTPWDWVVKSKLSPSCGPVALRQLKTTHKMGPFSLKCFT